MTKKEVRDEYKEMEGDPYIKSKRRQIHREIIAQSMANAVRKADVVVANPTHVAVAISYDRGEMDAPRIVAKGADFMAAQMREIATEANVPIMRDIPLARTLYELDIEDEIPENLYESVAVVLRWVYELNENKNN
jgi:flagellar biosynthesis protein FlhB